MSNFSTTLALFLMTILFMFLLQVLPGNMESFKLRTKKLKR